MNRSHNLSLLLLLAAAVGCGDDSASGTGGTGGAGGEGATGGTGAVGGAGGMGGAGAMGGAGGMGGGGGSGGSVVPSTCASGVPALLSEWALFDNIRDQVPSEDVIPYEVTSLLFTDNALKHRFVTLRDGGQIAYSDTERWQSPVGTIYVKTFAYPPNELENQTKEQLIETRLIHHVSAEDDRLGCRGADSCWNTHAYVYNEDMTDAVCKTGGAVVSVTYTDDEGQQQEVPNYTVPTSPAQCNACHGGDPTRTLSPSSGMLNRGNDYGGGAVANQIDQLYDLEMLAPAPIQPPEDRTTYDDPTEYTACQTLLCVHNAARSWFDSNCSHCHAPDGEVAEQGLYLDYQSMDPTNPTDLDFRSWGVCKTPTSGGCDTGQVDILPGDPDNSILPCRVDLVGRDQMAPLGRTLIDDNGVALIRQWIIDLPTLFPDIPTCSGPVEE